MSQGASTNPARVGRDAQEEARVHASRERHEHPVRGLYVELDVRLPDSEDSELSEAVRKANDAYSKPVREGLRI